MPKRWWSHGGRRVLGGFVTGQDLHEPLRAGNLAVLHAETPGSAQTRVVGRNPRRGTRLWTTPDLPPNEDGDTRTEIAAHAGTVYHTSASGNLVALDARSGAQRWTVSFAANNDVAYHRLTADHTTVVVHQHNRLWAFDPATGAERWDMRPDSRTVRNTAATGNGLVLVPRASSACIPKINGGMGPH
jgi:outer membrane protein assembly factor BamB